MNTTSIAEDNSKTTATTIITVVFVLIAGAIALGIQIGKSNLQDKDMKVAEPEPPKITDEIGGTDSGRSLYAPSDKINPVPDVWGTYTVPKTGPFKAFSINYPKEWALETKPTIRLTKGNAYFEIWRNSGSLNTCLFQEDRENPDVPENTTFFSSFREINKGTVAWRFATVEKPNAWDNTFVLCEKGPEDSFYSQSTSIGYVPFKIPQADTKTLSEVIDILEKIEIQ